MQYSLKMTLLSAHNLINYFSIRVANFGSCVQLVEVEALVRKEIALFQDLAKFKGVDILHSMRQAPHKLVITDRWRLTQILANILESVIIGAKPSTKIEIQSWLDFKLPQQGHICFKLTTTGEGKSFTSHSQLEKLAKKKRGLNSGLVQEHLGLIVSRLICEQLNGEFTVEVSEEQLLTLHFSLAFTVAPALGGTALDTTVASEQ